MNRLFDTVEVAIFIKLLDNSVYLYKKYEYDVGTTLSGTQAWTDYTTLLATYTTAKTPATYVPWLLGAANANANFIISSERADTFGTYDDAGTEKDVPAPKSYLKIATDAVSSIFITETLKFKGTP